MKYDVIVLGSGPGGYVTAIRASQLGLKTAVVEREALGGICLNWGCIPTKALLKSANVFEYIEHAEDYGIKVGAPKVDFEGMVKRSRGVAEGMSGGVTFLMKKNNIDVIMGNGKLLPGKKLEVTAADGAVSTLEADHIIVATGARSRQLPSLPQDGEKVIGYREAMTLKKQPKKMVVVGSGAIGIEFAYFYNAIGTEVTVVEYVDRIVPVEDKEVSKQLERTFKKAGIKIKTSSEVTGVDTSGSGCKVTVKTKKGEETLECDVVLSAAGVVSNIENIGLEECGIVHDTALLEADVLDVGHHAGRAQHDVALEGFFPLFGLHGDFAAAAGRVHAGDFGAGLDLDARLLEGALELLGDLLVLHGNNAVDVLHHSHLRADGVVEVGKLDADRARADDDHFLGLLLEGHRLAVANHLFTVLWKRRQLA